MLVFVDSAYLCLVVAIGVVPCLPQLGRLLRTGDPSGLSLPALLAGLVNHAAWTVYLSGAGATGLLVGNVLAWLVWTAMTVLAVRGLTRSRACLVPLAWMLVLLAVGTHLPEHLGTALGLGSLLVFLPQAVGAWRGPSVAGIAPLTWWLLLVQGLVWFGESLSGLLVGGLAFGVVCTASSLSVLLALSVRGRRPVLVDTPAPDAVLAA